MQNLRPPLFVFLYIFSALPAFAEEFYEWPGSGYPVFAYTAEPLPLFKEYGDPKAKTDLFLAERPGEVIDYGISVIVARKMGKLKLKLPFSLPCDPERSTSAFQVGEEFDIVIMRERAMILEREDGMRCQMSYRPSYEGVWYTIDPRPQQDWWIQVHSNSEIKKGWTLVSRDTMNIRPESNAILYQRYLDILPRQTSPVHHNNRRGISGDYIKLKVVVHEKEPKITGYFKGRKDSNAQEDIYETNCSFFFVGKLVEDYYQLEVIDLEKNEIFPAQLKYNWRAGESYIIFHIDKTKKVPPCIKKELERSPSFRLVKEGQWAEVAVLREDAPLYSQPNGRTIEGAAAPQNAIGIILDTRDDWMLLDFRPEVQQSGWIPLDKLLITDDAESLTCKAFEEIPGTPRAYQELDCQAKIKQRKGELAKAAELFRASLRITLKNTENQPTPNIENRAYLTALACQLGETKGIEQQIEDYFCMKRIKAGLLRCFLEKTKGELNRSEGITNVCFKQMCNNSFLPSYPLTPMSNEAEIQAEVAPIFSVCK